MGKEFSMEDYNNLSLVDYVEECKRKATETERAGIDPYLLSVESEQIDGVAYVAISVSTGEKCYPTKYHHFATYLGNRFIHFENSYPLDGGLSSEGIEKTKVLFKNNLSNLLLKIG